MMGPSGFRAALVAVVIAGHCRQRLNRLSVASRRNWAGAAVVAAIAGLALTPALANAATFTVDRGSDPVLNTCDMGSCSLRGAIDAAHNSAGPDTIILAPGTYTLTIPRGSLDPGLPEGFSGDLDIATDITIKNPEASPPGSPGAAEAMINANGQNMDDRALQVYSGKVKLVGVSVSGGVAPADGTANRHGGGIRVEPGASLSMRDGRIYGNSAIDTGARGGGLYNDAGTVSLKRVIVDANSTYNPNPNVTGGFGGGLHGEGPGTTKIANSVLRFNLAAFGGAISGAGFRISNTSIRRNEARFGGGGAGYLASATSTFENTSINHNLAISGSGSALRVRNGTAILESSTVTQNAGPGAAVSVQEDPGDQAGMTLKHTILAGNTSGGGQPDCSEEPAGQVTSQGSNIIGNITGCAFPPSTGDQVGTAAAPIDPLLGEPFFYGGALESLYTLPLLKGSPAISAGSPDPADCPKVDARGIPRKLGGRCDIGAYERVRCGGVVVNRVGTQGDDNLAAGGIAPPTVADGFLGLKGTDQVRGDDGDDGLCGNGGDDELKGRDGADHLVGGAGLDVCEGGPGEDTARGCEIERSIP